MSSQQLHQQTSQAAQKYGLNLGTLGGIVAAVQNHPEVVQLIQLAAQLRGNPNLIGQFQPQAAQLAVGVLVGLDGVLEYVAKAEQAAGVTPSPLFADLHSGVDGLLARYGPQAANQTQQANQAGQARQAAPANQQQANQQQANQQQANQAASVNPSAPANPGTPTP